MLFEPKKKNAVTLRAMMKCFFFFSFSFFLVFYVSNGRLLIFDGLWEFFFFLLFCFCFCFAVMACTVSIYTHFMGRSNEQIEHNNNFSIKLTLILCVEAIMLLHDCNLTWRAPDTIPFGNERVTIKSSVRFLLLLS